MKPSEAGYENVAFPEGVVAIMLPANLPIPVLELGEVKTITTKFDEARYLFFHWPWSKSGDVESHSLFSLN